MSTVADFNRIEDCDKIDANCIDAFSEMTLNEGILCVETSWGKQCVDLEPVVKALESCTTLYLSPDDNPNCLVYEPEEKCGDNICIHGDDLSRIISMTKLKDVDQETPIDDGNVYIYNTETNLFEPYDLKTFVTNTNVAIQNINAAISNLQNRVSAIEEKITPPEGTPDTARIVHGTINIYGDYGAVVNGSGVATSLDKTHGLYSHSLNTDAVDDQIMG